jgi:hypothetical protein
LGKMQNALMATIRQHGKPMTFAEMRATASDQPGVKLRPSFERSVRRALHSLTTNNMLIAMGDGGPGDPLRYFLHPLLIGFLGDTPEAKALQAALEADSGANEAAGRFMAKHFKG